MEGVTETGETGETTAGKPAAPGEAAAAEEKLLPPGEPPVSEKTLPKIPDAKGVSLVSPALLQSFVASPKTPEPAPEEAAETERVFEIPKTSVGSTPKAPPIILAADVLHGGNVVAAALTSSKKETPETTPEENLKKKEEEEEELPIERNLREVGLKEALPHQERSAPERPHLAESAPQTGTPRIRTYAEDMGREIQKRGATISSIVAAEQARPQEDAPAKAARTRSNLFLLGAAFLVILGIAAVIATVFFFRSAPAAPAVRQSIIPVNSRSAIEETDGTPLASTLAEARASASIPLGNVEELDIEKGGSPLSASDILTALGAPNELARNATGILIGLHAGNHTQPFMLVSVAAYDRAFQAMLAWEGTIGDSLGSFFAPQEGGVHAPGLAFTDRVQGNLDIRESQPEWHILYAFPQQGLLLITTDSTTMTEILTRLSLGKNTAE